MSVVVGRKPGAAMGCRDEICETMRDGRCEREMCKLRDGEEISEDGGRIALDGEMIPGGSR